MTPLAPEAGIEPAGNPPGNPPYLTDIPLLPLIRSALSRTPGWAPGRLRLRVELLKYRFTPVIGNHTPVPSAQTAFTCAQLPQPET